MTVWITATTIIRTNSTTVVQTLDKRLVLGSNPGSCMKLASRLTGRTAAFEVADLGSNPSRPESCMSSRG